MPPWNCMQVSITSLATSPTKSFDIAIFFTVSNETSPFLT